jgi:hypothetical protein
VPKNGAETESVGAAADQEWLLSVRSIYDGLKHGERSALAKRMNMTRDRLSKLVRRGSGSVEEVMALSREFCVPPPRRLLDNAQYNVLLELESYRTEVAKRFGKEAVSEETQALIRRLRLAAAELLGQK